MSTRIGGRQKGTGNVPALEKIKANKNKFEKMLYDMAMDGDVNALAACLRLLAEAEARERAERKSKLKSVNSVPSSSTTS